MKIFLKYLVLVFIGLSLAFAYSYILKHDFSTGFNIVFSTDISAETIIVFFVLYAYMIAFIKFLIKLFK